MMSLVSTRAILLPDAPAGQGPYEVSGWLVRQWNPSPVALCLLPSPASRLSPFASRLASDAGEGHEARARGKRQRATGEGQGGPQKSARYWTIAGPPVLWTAKRSVLTCGYGS